ncbi:hypothetical protein O6H91_09G024600 [Diphasiastrum complanatum]|uniref:Uncharacterized protein n=1 Tax=Diphasiastrum complanatum TaxID=34168 RepID=A0ACC2CM70_DIPCM|nr:hypothetical protein O6H91_09G024600 [Diphasiastrum complanatum]
MFKQSMFCLITFTALIGLLSLLLVWEEDDVWSQVAKAQLKEGLVSDAIESFIRANDATQFNDVILAAEHVRAYDDLVKYLLMVRKKVKEPKVILSLSLLMQRLINWEKLRSSFSSLMLQTSKMLEIACLMKHSMKQQRLSSHTSLTGPAGKHTYQAQAISRSCGCCPKGQ